MSVLDEVLSRSYMAAESSVCELRLILSSRVPDEKWSMCSLSLSLNLPQQSMNDERYLHGCCSFQVHVL